MISMKKIILLFVIALAVDMINPSRSSATEKIYMPFFELINVHSDYQYSTARLFKNYVDEDKRYTLIIPQKPDSMVSQPSAEKIRETAKSLNCEYYMIGDMNRIGEIVIISVNIYKTDNGETIWNDRLKAANPEDIDPILQKLARNIGTKQKATNDGDIYSVTSQQSQNLKQVRSNNAFGVSIGGVYMMSKPYTSDAFAGGGGAFWTYDVREMIYDINTQIYFMGGPSLGQISINAYKPFYSESNSPFIGGGLGVGYAYYTPPNTSVYSNYSYSGSGLMLFIGGGYIIGRSSNVGLRIRANYMISTFNITSNHFDYMTTISKEEKYLPHGLILNLELYFGK